MSTGVVKEFVDAHHHFICTKSNGSTFHKFMHALLPNFAYVAEDYQRDVIDPLEKAGIRFGGSVHMECIPDDGFEEVQWVTESFVKPPSSSSIKGVIASCDLSQEISVVESELQALSKIEYVKGVRWILDCVGKFDDGKTATHIATTRHDGIDYLRGSDGGYKGQTVPAFDKGFALLEKYKFTFDLQCAPAQLLAASKLCARHPNIKVVIDHLGKPRTLLGADIEDNRNNLALNEVEITVWRDGMKALAQNKNVYVKISMLGYVIPGWIRTKERKQLMRSIVRETVELFGPERTMIATNYWKDSVTSDNDGMSDVGPDAVTLLELLYGFLNDYSEDDLDHIFSKTASRFYNL